MKKIFCLVFAVMLLFGVSAYSDNTTDDMQTKYEEDRAKVMEWEDALSQEQALYIGLSTLMSKKLLLYSITCEELSRSDRSVLTSSCLQIKNSLLRSIEYAWTRDYEWNDRLFPVGVDDAMRNFLLDIIDSRYQGLRDKTESLGEELSNQMFSVVDDNIITMDERETVEHDYLSAMHEIQNGISTNKHRNE